MTLQAENYLNWYNGEITRYRDIEWRVSGYAGAFALALVYLATDPMRRALVEPYLFVVVPILLVFTVFLILSEAHIHRSLNTWRKRRDSVVSGATDHLTQRGMLIGRMPDGSFDRVDLAYFWAFEAFICGSALLAVGVVAPSYLTGASIVVVLVLTWACCKGDRMSAKPEGSE